MTDIANDNRINGDLGKLDKNLNPWIPMNNKRLLALIGKLGEETNESGSAICRCIIQGVNEAHPETGKVNLVWLFEEMADVAALSALVMAYLDPTGIYEGAFKERMERKMTHIRAWLEKIPDNSKATFEEMFDV